MSPIASAIQKLSVLEKAELYYLLGADTELNDYLFSDKHLFDELTRRDAELAAGNLQLMTRKELTQRLTERRNGL